MNLKEKISCLWNGVRYFLNVTLGVDIQEQEDIETSNDPKLAELKESLERVKELEQKATNSSTNSGKKGGKGNSKVVETVNIDPRTALKSAEIQKENTSEEMER